MDIDPDDNKYCDYAIAGKAEYLVTEDKHWWPKKYFFSPDFHYFN
jgi:predicted nucleic acid-binding protein